MSGKSLVICLIAFCVLASAVIVLTLRNSERHQVTRQELKR